MAIKSHDDIVSFVRYVDYLRKRGYDTETAMDLANAHMDFNVTLAACKAGACNICPDADSKFALEMASLCM